MMTAGLALSALGFGALGVDAWRRWWETGEPLFLPFACLGTGFALAAAGLAWELLLTNGG